MSVTNASSLSNSSDVSLRNRSASFGINALHNLAWTALSKDDEVFALTIDPPNEPETKKKPGPAKKTAEPAPPPPRPKWQLATVISMHDSVVKIKLSSSGKEIEVPTADASDKIVPRGSLVDVIKTGYDVAALSRSFKTKAVLDCLIRCSALDDENVFSLNIARSAAAIVRACGSSSSSQREAAQLVAEKARNSSKKKGFIVALRSPDVVAEIIADNNISSYSSGSSEKKSAGKIIDNIQRLFRWLFGDENGNKTAILLVEGGESSSEPSIACFPQFSLAKATLLPSGDTPSSSADDAAGELGIHLNTLQTAIAWLAGLQKLWRLLPAAAGFKGTEPDLVDAAGCLIPETEDGPKVLADFFCMDKSSSKAPAAQFDERRQALAQVVVQEICCSLFFPLSKFLSSTSSSSSALAENNVLFYLPDIPACENLGVVPFTLGACEMLKSRFRRQRLEDCFPPVLKFLQRNVDGLEIPAEKAKPAKNFQESIKEIGDVLAGAGSGVMPSGKDSMQFTSIFGVTVKFITNAWAARVFAHRALFRSNIFEDSLKILEVLMKSTFFPESNSTTTSSSSSAEEGENNNNINARHVGLCVTIPTPPATTTSENEKNPPSNELATEELDLLVAATEYFREQPVESMNAEEIKMMRFTVAEKKDPAAAQKVLPALPSSPSSPPTKPGSPSSGKSSTASSTNAKAFGSPKTTTTSSSSSTTSSASSSSSSSGSSSAKKEELTVSEISDKLLKKLLALSGGYADTKTLGSFDSASQTLQLSVLGKLAMDMLRQEFADTTLLHISKRVQYLFSAKRTLSKACHRTVQVVSGSGFQGRFSSELVAHLAMRKAILDDRAAKKAQRQYVEDRETRQRHDIESEKQLDMQSLLAQSGGFLIPVIRRRKHKALLDEQEERLALMKLEKKELQALFERFFDEEPEEPVPVPQAGLAKIRERYEVVRPAVEEEEEGRKQIMIEGRELLLNIVAKFELKLEKMKKHWKPRKPAEIPWEQLERAAERRQKDETRAVEFLYPASYSHQNQQLQQLQRQQQQQQQQGRTTSNNNNNKADQVPKSNSIGEFAPLRVNFTGYWQNFK